MSNRLKQKEARETPNEKIIPKAFANRQPKTKIKFCSTGTALSFVKARA